jgi:6-phosphogluconolactonase
MPNNPGSPTSPGSNPPPPAPSSGGFAAGIGGAGQKASARFLIAAQVPGSTPFPTVIGSAGTLTAAKASANPVGETNPMSIVGAIDPTGSFLYQAEWSGLTAFTIDRQSGNVTEMSNSPYETSHKFDGVAVDQLGKFVYAYGDGQVFAFSIQAGTGQLSAIAGSPFASSNSGQQFAGSSLRMAVSQDDRFLFVGSDSGIFAYTIDATTGALTMVPGSPFGAGTGEAFAIVAPSSGYLYESAAGGKSPIHGYKIDSNTGALTEIAGSPFGSNCSASNLTSPASGKFLFAPGCGMYSINTVSGALTPLFADPLAPNSTWAVFDPTAKFLWELNSQEPCFHCDVGVTTFQVDANTGQMTEVPNSFFFMTNSEVGDIQSLAITQ